MKGYEVDCAGLILHPLEQSFRYWMKQKYHDIGLTSPWTHSRSIEPIILQHHDLSAEDQQKTTLTGQTHRRTARNIFAIMVVVEMPQDVCKLDN
jgi:hypothetical protein